MQGIHRNQAKQGLYYNRRPKSLEQLREDDRPFTPGQREWVDGQAVKEIRPRSYEVHAGGKVIRRYLRKYEPNEDVETTAEPPAPEISMQTPPALETWNKHPTPNN